MYGFSSGNAHMLVYIYGIHYPGSDAYWLGAQRCCVVQKKTYLSLSHDASTQNMPCLLRGWKIFDSKAEWFNIVIIFLVKLIMYIFATQDNFFSWVDVILQPKTAMGSCCIICHSKWLTETLTVFSYSLLSVLHYLWVTGCLILPLLAVWGHCDLYVTLWTQAEFTWSPHVRYLYAHWVYYVMALSVYPLTPFPHNNSQSFTAINFKPGI